MSLRIDRRTLLTGLLVSSGTVLSGCSSGGEDDTIPSQSLSETDETPSSTPATPQNGPSTLEESASGGLSIDSGTESTQTVSVTVVEAPDGFPSFDNPGTLTAQTAVSTASPLFEKETTIEGGGHKGFSDVFPEPTGEVTYHVFARLADSEAATYGFENFPGSGFGYVSVFIASESEIQISHAVA